MHLAFSRCIHGFIRCAPADLTLRMCIPDRTALLSRPVKRPTVMLVQTSFVLTCQRNRPMVRGTLFDRGASDMNMRCTIRPTHLVNPLGRDHDVPAGPPA